MTDSLAVVKIDLVAGARLEVARLLVLLRLEHSLRCQVVAAPSLKRQVGG